MAAQTKLNHPVGKDQGPADLAEAQRSAALRPSRTAAAALAGIIQEQQAKREQAHREGLPALSRLVTVALRDTGQSRICGRFLLGLYSGEAFPFNLVSLRGLDDELHQDCLRVLMLDASPVKEVHEHYPCGQVVWNQLAHLWGDRTHG